MENPGYLLDVHITDERYSWGTPSQKMERQTPQGQNFLNHKTPHPSAPTTPINFKR